MTNNVFLDKKVKTQQQQNKNNLTLKPLPETGISAGPLAPKANAFYLCTTESTESKDCSQAI